MRGWSKIAVIVTVVGITAWLFVGWEVSSVDHETRYVVFVKSYPTTTLLFHSYMGCDECDAPSYTALSQDRQGEFTEFCRAKYGFADPRICDAIYAKQQKLRLDALKNHQSSKP